MRLHDSARKHFRRDRLTEAGVLHACEEPAYQAPLDLVSYPRRRSTSAATSGSELGVVMP